MTQAGTELEFSPTTLAMFAEMATALEAYDTGGGDAIVQAILKATSIDEYNDIFSGDRGMPLNVPFKITRARHAPSDFAAGLPFYLVVEAENTQTHVAGEFTVGAVVPVSVITGAAFKGQLPIIIRMYESDKPTKSGYKPVNVEVLAMSSPTLDAPAAASKSK